MSLALAGALWCMQATADVPSLEAVSKKTGVSVDALQYAVSQAQYQQKIIDAITRPSEAKPWWQYRKIFITNERIKKGIEFYLANEQDLQRAERIYGVPPEIVCAIIGVETFYGRNMGNWKVLDALYTLGFGYEKRAPYFSSEFGNFVKLCLMSDREFERKYTCPEEVIDISE